MKRDTDRQTEKKNQIAVHTWSIPKTNMTVFHSFIKKKNTMHSFTEKFFSVELLKFSVVFVVIMCVCTCFISLNNYSLISFSFSVCLMDGMIKREIGLGMCFNRFTNILRISTRFLYEKYVYNNKTKRLYTQLIELRWLFAHVI